MRLIDECRKCNADFLEKVPMIVEKGKPLTNEQVEVIFIELGRRHLKH